MYKLPKYDWLCIYSVTRVKQNVHGAARKRHKVQSVPVEMQTRNADKKCYLRCGCGQKLQCTNGKNETTEWENAHKLPGCAVDRHRAENQQSEEEIKVNYVVD